MAGVGQVPEVHVRRVGRDSVVPEDDGVGLPSHSSLVVRALVDVVVEKSEDSL